MLHVGSMVENDLPAAAGMLPQRTSQRKRFSLPVFLWRNRFVCHQADRSAQLANPKVLDDPFSWTPPRHGGKDLRFGPNFPGRAELDKILRNQRRRLAGGQPPARLRQLLFELEKHLVARAAHRRIQRYSLKPRARKRPRGLRISGAIAKSAERRGTARFLRSGLASAFPARWNASAPRTPHA